VLFLLLLMVRAMEGDVVVVLNGFEGKEEEVKGEG
jgi:hypothetical protein